MVSHGKVLNQRPEARAKGSRCDLSKIVAICPTNIVISLRSARARSDHDLHPENRAVLTMSFLRVIPLAHKERCDEAVKVYGGAICSSEDRYFGSGTPLSILKRIRPFAFAASSFMIRDLGRVPQKRLRSPIE